MVPILAILNGVIWYGVARAYQQDKVKQPQVNIEPITISPYQEKDEDILIKQNFEHWLENERRRDSVLEDYLWKEGIINPEETIWCEGVPLDPTNPKDLELFEQIKDKALLEGIYHGKNLNEGGLEDLYKTWFMLKGCSDYGAEMLIASGVEPWNFEL